MNATSRRTLFRSCAIVLAFGLSLVPPAFCGSGEVGHRPGRQAWTGSPGTHTGAGETTSPSENSRPSKRPNVLLVGIDTLRADHVGCCGYAKDTTPTLDRLAHEGVLCTQTMSTSGWTLPSVMSALTSLYPSVHQVYTYQHRLSEGVITLAEILKANGYTTAGFVSNPLVHGQYGFSDGFDLYDDFTVALDSGLDIFGNHNETFQDQHLVCTSELVTRTVAKWLEQQAREPFFLFLFYMDPHYDYLPPAPFDTLFDPTYRGTLDGRGIRKEPRHSQRPSDRDLQHLLALYDGEIRYTDTYVAKLVQCLADRRLLENTFVILFSDHGEEFYEHGKTAHDRTLYEEILHVPLILWWPHQLPAGRRVEALTSLVDIVPTVLDYLGLPQNHLAQGLSLRPLLEGKVDRLHDTVWAELNTWTHVQAVRGDHDKLVRNVGNGTWELYHLPQDPGERSNRYDQPSAADDGRVLRARWERWIKDNDVLSHRFVPGTKTLDAPAREQQLQQLKGLGYLQ